MTISVAVTPGTEALLLPPLELLELEQAPVAMTSAATHATARPSRTGRIIRGAPPFWEKRGQHGAGAVPRGGRGPVGPTELRSSRRSTSGRTRPRAGCR